MTTTEESITINFTRLLRLKEAAEDKRWTYEKIADATGLSKTTIGSYSHGRATRFEESTLIALCRFFGCELAELIQYRPANWGEETAES